MKPKIIGYSLTAALALLLIVLGVVIAKGTMSANRAQAAAKTPMTTDGHPDLTGLWFTYRGANLVVRQEGNTRINLQPTSRAPESEDPENNLSVNTRIYSSVAEPTSRS